MARWSGPDNENDNQQQQEEEERVSSASEYEDAVEQAVNSTDSENE